MESRPSRPVSQVEQRYRPGARSRPPVASRAHVRSRSRHQSLNKHYRNRSVSRSRNNNQNHYKNNRSSSRSAINSRGLNAGPEKVTVSICSVFENHFFGKPVTSLPQGYAQDKDVFIRRNLLEPFDKYIKNDDLLQVRLGYYNPQKPEATKAEVIEIRSPRSDQELISFFSSVIEDLTFDDTSKSSASDVERVVSHLKTNQIWSFYYGSKLLNTKNSKLILLKLQLANKLATFSKTVKFHVRAFYSTIIDSGFLEPNDIPENLASITFWKELKQFFGNVIEMQSEKVINLIPILDKAALNVSDKQWIKYFKNYSQGMSNVKSDFSLLEWDQLPNVPVTEEIFGKVDNNDRRLQSVLVDESYNSVSHYLDTYFRLLRENCFAGLKTGIRSLLDNKLDFRDMNVYRGISFKGVVLSETGVVLVMSLDTRTLRQGQKVKSGDLQYGNLVCLSASGSFEDPVWATVYMREEDQQPDSVNNNRVPRNVGFALELSTATNDIAFEHLLRELDCASGHLNLVESPAYYKAHDPVLSNLQNMDVDNLAFKDQLVSLRPPNAPKYRENLQTTDNGDILFPEIGVLDDSQRKALINMFENEVAIVQGPPGCGKTFLGTKFVEVLMSLNPALTGPVVLLTYKNHALDEFLKHVLKFLSPTQICRIGGRSEASELETANLRNMRKEAYKSGKVSYAMKQEKYGIISQLDEAKRNFCDALRENEQKLRMTPLDFALKYLNHNQIWSFLMSRPIQYSKDMNLQTINVEKGKNIVVNQISEATNNALVCCNDLGISNANLKSVLIQGYGRSPFLDDVLQILEKAIKLWLPNDKFIKEVQEEFFLNPEENAAANIPTANSGLVDDQDDIDLEMDRFKVLADSKSFGFKDFQELSESAVKLDFSRNSLQYPEALRLQSFAADLCRNSPKNLLANCQKLLEMPNRVRLIAIQSAMLASLESEEEQQTAEGGTLKISEALQRFKDCCEAKAEIESRINADIIRDSKVIGMTITGASINRHLIDMLKPAVIVVEEAAEVLEPQLTALLKPYVQHLVMIGDHKQLRPRVESFELVKEFKFDISMMERLIQGGIPYSQLQFQNRMRPQISAYLNDIYPNLQDGPKTAGIKQIPIFSKSLLFWTHQCLEFSDRSYSNEEEAKRCAELANFLVGQGFEPSTITIIAAYNGQKALVRMELEALWKDTSKNNFDESQMNINMSQDGNHIQIQTIDMYQGDENEIVIVSLTRSNDKFKVGFMKELNRRCVAQSRAKRLCIFIGNEKMFKDLQHWKPFIHKLQRNKAISSELTINCPRPDHKSLTVIEVLDSTGFPQPDFCKQICGNLMDCRLHKCPKRCQPSHLHNQCKQLIQYKDSRKCDHERTRECYQDPKLILCGKPCAFIFTGCGHLCTKDCDPKHEHSYCATRVPTSCKVCKGPLHKQCHELESKDKCNSHVQIICSKCQKPGTKRCHESIASYTCLEICVKLLSFCGHPCSKLCWQECPNTESNCPKCQELIRLENERRNKKESKKQHSEEARKFRQELEDVRNGVQGAVSFSRQDLSLDGETSAEYMKIEDMVLKSVQRVHHWYPQVTRIEKIKNSELSAKFYESVANMFDPSYIDHKFHRTGKEAVESIIRTGFRKSREGMYGPGVYLATDSSKSAQEMYTKQSNMLLVCRVGLGKTKRCEKAWNSVSEVILTHEGYDSIFAPRDTKGTGGVRFDEFVVFDPDRVLPEYIVHYSKNGVPTSGIAQQVFTAGAMTVGGGYKKIKLELKREINDLQTQNYMMAAAVFHTLSSRSNYRGPKTLSAIYYHCNPQLESLFESECTKMKKKYPGDKGDPILAFHGTPNDSNLEKIAKNNFDMSKLSRGAFGWGVYFSELPEVSLDYAKGLQKLLLCKILPGDSRIGDCGQSRRGSFCSCDSHKINAEQDGRGWAIVMNNVNRILPCFELHLK